MPKGVKLTDLKPDHKNPNRGTRRGRENLLESIRRLGAGRSALVDKDNRIIAGNKTIEAAIAAGLKKAVIVESEGEELIIVRRKDLSLEEGGKARELSVADNRIAETGLDWDKNILAMIAEEGADLDPFFSGDEVRKILADLDITDDLFGSEPGEAPPASDAVELRVTAPPKTAQKIMGYLDSLRGVKWSRKEGKK